MEMTARNFIAEAKRLCASQKYCDGCPLAGLHCAFGSINTDQLEAVEKWAAEHPADPDEVERVFTLEYTMTDNLGLMSDADMEDRGKEIARKFERFMNGGKLYYCNGTVHYVGSKQNVQSWKEASRD